MDIKLDNIFNKVKMFRNNMLRYEIERKANEIVWGTSGRKFKSCRPDH